MPLTAIGFFRLFILFFLFSAAVFVNNRINTEIINKLLIIEYFSNGKIAYFYFFRGNYNKGLHGLFKLKTKITAF